MIDDSGAAPSTGLAEARNSRDARIGIHYGWAIVIALGVTITVSYGTLYYSMGVFLTPVKEETGWSSGAISGAFALSLLVAGLIGIPVGRLTDRFGSRRVMVVGSALGVAGLLLFSVAETLWVLYVAWGVVIGAAAAASFYPPAFVVLANWFQDRRGRALGLLTFLGGFASIIFIPLAAMLIHEYGWRSAARVLALIILLIALPLHAFVVRSRPEELAVAVDAEQDHDRKKGSVQTDAPAEYSTITRSGEFWLITGAFFLATFATSTVFVHQLSYLVDSGFDETDVAVAAGLIGVASLPGRFLLSTLTERVDAAVITSAVLCLLATSLLALILAASLPMVYGYVLLFGVAFGAITPLRAAIMLDQFGTTGYGKILGIQGAALAVAAATGPLLAGALRDITGGYEATFAITIGVYVIAAVLTAITVVVTRPIDVALSSNSS